LAFKWRFGKKKDKDENKASVFAPSDTLHGGIEETSLPVSDEEDLSSRTDESVIEEVPAPAEETPAPVEEAPELPAEENLPENADSAVPSEEESPEGPFAVSEEVEEPTKEEPVEEIPEEIPSEDTIDEVARESTDESADDQTEEAIEESSDEEAPVPIEEVETPGAEESEAPEEVAPEEESAETSDTIAEEEQPAEETTSEEMPVEEGEEASVEEALLDTDRESDVTASEMEEALAADDAPVVATIPEEKETESPVSDRSEEGETPFVMDDEYMKAFMEEGAMDDYIYGGSFEEKQDLLDRIADNAETLAEEGTELLEKKAQEQAEKKEPRYNEKGELLDDDGKAILKRSLENKLILADTRERRYYNKLKNEILSYEGIKCEMQSASEVFRQGKQVVARLAVAGFTRIYFALNPEEFDVERYKQSDKQEIDFEDAKMLLRVRDDDEFAIATELLAIMMGAMNINKAENPVTEDYLPAFPRREDAVLDKKGKYLSLEEKDEQTLLREKRAEERRAAGISEEVLPEEPVEKEVKEEPPVILPLTLDNKIHQSTNTIKLLYSKLKNELLSYKTVKAEMNVKNENFKSAKKIIARMTMVAESVRLYLALDPAAYSTKKFKHRDASDQQGYEGTLLMLKISGEKERETASKLIAELMQKLNLERNKRYAYVPFAEKYPYIKNGIFKGDEDKPRVKHEGEEYIDIYGELTEHLRSQMGATDAWGVPKGYTAEDGLSARDLLEIQRSKAKTINAGVALATPIVYFYDAAINEAGEVQYLNVQQVLNDKFLGKMIPQEYFAMAESSSRIEELNFFALDSIVKDCNENPTMRFALKISCRLLLKQETLTKLVEKMKTENGNLILAFDCAMLEAVGFVGISAINTLKSQGALIMIDNAESASMRVLTEYDFDYLRLDARYYNGDSSKRLAHLDMITGYADVQNIITTSINCEHKEEARILLDHGVKVIQGDAAARPMRLINLALTNIKPVPKVKKNGEEK